MTDKRVLFILNDTYSMIRFRSNIIRKLQLEGCRVDTLTPFDRQYEDELSAISDCSYYIPIARRIDPFEDMRSCLLFFIFCLRNRSRYSVVHTMTLKPNMFFAPIARLVFRKKARIVGLVSGLGLFLPSQLESHSIQSKLFRTILRKAFTSFDKVWVQNPDDITALDQSRVLPRSKAVLGFGSGIELKGRPTSSWKIREEDILAKYDIPDSRRFIFLCAARATPEKGLLEFVQASREVEERSDLNFVIVAPPEDNGVNCLEDEELPRSVTYINSFIPAADVDRIIQASFAICLPSYYPEGVPRFLLEGLACSKPVITTDTPGCREAVRHLENGYIVPQRNAKALASAIVDLATLSSEDYKRMCNSSKDLAVKKFSTEALWARLRTDLYGFD